MDMPPQMGVYSSAQDDEYSMNNTDYLAMLNHQQVGVVMVTVVIRGVLEVDRGIIPYTCDETPRLLLVSADWLLFKSDYIRERHLLN